MSSLSGNIPDPTVPVVDINLDRVRHLVYDFIALAAIEGQLPGESVFRVGEVTKIKGPGGEEKFHADNVFWKEISAQKLIVVLWAGLLDEDPEITLEQVKKLLRRRDPAPIVQKIMEAWGLSSPEPKEENPPAPATAMPTIAG